MLQLEIAILESDMEAALTIAASTEFQQISNFFSSGKGTYKQDIHGMWSIFTGEADLYEFSVINLDTNPDNGIAYHLVYRMPKTGFLSDIPIALMYVSDIVGGFESDYGYNYTCAYLTNDEIEIRKD